jgi:hypothetical protein
MSVCAGQALPKNNDELLKIGALPTDTAIFAPRARLFRSISPDASCLASALGGSAPMIRAASWRL